MVSKLLIVPFLEYGNTIALSINIIGRVSPLTFSMIQVDSEGGYIIVFSVHFISPILYSQVFI